MWSSFLNPKNTYKTFLVSITKNKRKKNLPIAQETSMMTSLGSSGRVRSGGCTTASVPTTGTKQPQAPVALVVVVVAGWWGMPFVVVVVPVHVVYYTCKKKFLMSLLLFLGIAF